MFFGRGLKVGLCVALLGVALTVGASAKDKAAWAQSGNDSGHTGYAADAAGINSKTALKLANTGSYTSNGSIIYQPVIFDRMIYFRSGDGNFYAYDLATKQTVWSIPSYQSPASNWGFAVGKTALVTNCVTGNNISGLCGYNPKTGKALWTFMLDNGGVYTPPAIDGNTAYVLSWGAEKKGSVDAQHLVAVNLKTGKEIWRVWHCDDYPTCEGFGGTPAVVNGMVYVGCSGVSRYPQIQVVGACAFTAGGTFVWQHQLGNDSNNNGTDGSGLISAVGSNVYVAYKTNCNQCNYSVDVTALDGASGNTLWDTVIAGPYNGEANALGAPVVGPDGATYEAVGANDDLSVTSLSSSGASQWSVDTTNFHLYGAPTLAGKTKGSTHGALFFTCGAQNQGTTCALDASNGSMIWQSSDINVQFAFPPLVADGVVYNVCGFNNICIYEPARK
jgi:outer membrane protein assembly factor BamB